MARFSAHLTYLFSERRFPERFAAAARAGFKACEFRFPFEHPAGDIADWLHDSGLQNVIFNMPAGDWARGERGIAALPGMVHAMAGIGGQHEITITIEPINPHDQPGYFLKHQAQAHAR